MCVTGSGAHDLSHRRGKGEKKERFQELGHGAELDSDASRNVYISLPLIEFCHVTSCNRQGTLSGPVLRGRSLK